ncbi:hypothetical protein FOTG_19266 [Fusarium oxysporum f. sp. vasinfectum 25433]|uniref:Uncharacterized protein n=1 Tax=Fusarium oxysporum f. sp. vasinfectum 25433 TaxID=1089449 RepID=X0KFE1_FUSOX|nr:hypothetical protein FOTG_19266 [Fusarium oxysporum f. sp. vasinfectum 25433]
MDRLAVTLTRSQNPRFSVDLGGREGSRQLRRSVPVSNLNPNPNPEPPLGWG